MRTSFVLGWTLLTAVASAQTRPALPAEVDLVPQFRKAGLAPWNQAGRDTCSLHAVTGAANFEWSKTQSGMSTPFSTEFLVWAAREACAKDHDQAMFYEAIQGLNAFGLCPEKSMPNQPTATDPERKPSQDALKESQTLRNRWNARWIRRWDVQRRMPDRQLTEIRRALAEGHPVACGLRWPKSKKDEELIQPPAPEGVRDGHSILLVGYRDDAKQPGGGVFRFRNSYGAQWGNEGYGLMSYAYVQAYANDAFYLELLPPNGETPIQRFECEELAVGAKEKCEASPQSTEQWGARLWSGARHLLCKTENGGFIELTFDVREEGTYRIRILASGAPDYGRMRASVDGQDASEAFDLRSGRVCPAGALELGQQKLTAGRHTLRLSAAGRRSSTFGVDALDLLPPIP